MIAAVGGGVGAKWKKKVKPEIALDKIKESSKVDESGVVSFHGFSFFEDEALLHSMIDYGEKLSFDTKKTLRDRAVRACIRNFSLNPDAFLKELNREISLYKGAAVSDYVLTTSLSIKDGLPISRMKFDGVVVQGYSGKLPEKYNTRSQNDKRWRELYKDEPPLPENYTPVVVRVKAKSTSDAFDNALDALDYVRGLIALNVNPGNSYSFGVGSPRPLNKVMLGGMHCLHHKNGSLVGDQFWYERHFESRDSVYLGPKKKAVKGGVVFLHQGVHKYSGEDFQALFYSIVRYARAFDEHDRDVVIQRLWGAIESLVAPGENNADKIVRRCSFLFDQRDYAAQVLEYLRDYRNQNVHRGYSESGLDNHCYQLQRFFRELVAYYARGADFYSSLAEANSFLDSSDNRQSLERSIELLQKAIKFRFG